MLSVGTHADDEALDAGAVVPVRDYALYANGETLVPEVRIRVKKNLEERDRGGLIPLLVCWMRSLVAKEEEEGRRAAGHCSKMGRLMMEDP